MDDATLPQGFVALRTRIAELKKELEERDGLLKKRQSEIADKETVIQELTKKVELLRLGFFARRSEKQAKPSSAEQQYWLFDEAEFAVEVESESEEEP